MTVLIKARRTQKVGVPSVEVAESGARSERGNVENTERSPPPSRSQTRRDGGAPLAALTRPKTGQGDDHPVCVHPEDLPFVSPVTVGSFLPPWSRIR